MFRLQDRDQDTLQWTQRFLRERGWKSKHRYNTCSCSRWLFIFQKRRAHDGFLLPSKSIGDGHPSSRHFQFIPEIRLAVFFNSAQELSPFNRRIQRLIISVAGKSFVRRGLYVASSIVNQIMRLTINRKETVRYRFLKIKEI